MIKRIKAFPWPCKHGRPWHRTCCVSGSACDSSPRFGESERLPETVTGRAGGVARGQRGQQGEHPAGGDIAGSIMPTARCLDPSLLSPGLTWDVLSTTPAKPHHLPSPLLCSPALAFPPALRECLCHPSPLSKAWGQGAAWGLTRKPGFASVLLSVWSACLSHTGPTSEGPSSPRTRPSAMQPAWGGMLHRTALSVAPERVQDRWAWVMAEGVSIWGPQFLQSSSCAHHLPHRPFPEGSAFWEPKPSVYEESWVTRFGTTEMGRDRAAEIKRGHLPGSGLLSGKLLHQHLWGPPTHSSGHHTSMAAPASPGPPEAHRLSDAIPWVVGAGGQEPWAQEDCLLDPEEWGGRGGQDQQGMAWVCPSTPLVQDQTCL